MTDKMTIYNTDTNEKKLTWWEKFLEESSDIPEIVPILELMEQIEKDKSEETFRRIQEAIEGLDTNKFKKELRVLKKRERIIERRFERQINESFGSLIRFLREKKGYSLAQLGELTGVSSSYITKIELGNRNAPSYPILVKIAEALDVNPTELLGAAKANDKDNKETVTSIAELIYSSNTSVSPGQEPMTLEQKEKIVEIIEYIATAPWKSNKHIETINLVHLVDEFKTAK